MMKNIEQNMSDSEQPRKFTKRELLFGLRDKNGGNLEDNTSSSAEKGNLLKRVGEISLTRRTFDKIAVLFLGGVVTGLEHKRVSAAMADLERLAQTPQPLLEIPKFTEIGNGFFNEIISARIQAETNTGLGTFDILNEQQVTNLEVTLGSKGTKFYQAYQKYLDESGGIVVPVARVTESEDADFYSNAGFFLYVTEDWQASENFLLKKGTFITFDLNGDMHYETPVFVGGKASPRVVDQAFIDEAATQFGDNIDLTDLQIGDMVFAEFVPQPGNPNKQMLAVVITANMAIASRYAVENLERIENAAVAVTSTPTPSAPEPTTVDSARDNLDQYILASYNQEQVPVEADNTWSSSESMTNLADQPPYIQEVDSKAMGVWFTGTGFAEDRSLAMEFLAAYPEFTDVILHPQAEYWINLMMADLKEQVLLSSQPILYISVENGVATLTDESFSNENLPNLVIEKHDSSQYGNDMAKIIQMGVPDGEISKVRLDFDDPRYHAIRVKENGVYKVKMYIPETDGPWEIDQQNEDISSIFFGITGKDWHKDYWTSGDNWSCIVTSTHSLNS